MQDRLRSFRRAPHRFPLRGTSSVCTLFFTSLKISRISEALCVVMSFQFWPFDLALAHFLLRSLPEFPTGVESDLPP